MNKKKKREELGFKPMPSAHTPSLVTTMLHGMFTNNNL
jgi:hypothetical protein